MPSDRLYKLAFEYKKTKLWQRIGEEELFAVRTADGEILWCIIMGSIGQHIALSAYRGDSGLLSLRKMLDVNADTFEKMILQDCMQCSFENKNFLQKEELDAVRAYAKANQITLRGAYAFPQFISYKPYHYPWMTDEQEEGLLCEALEAMLFIAEKPDKFFDEFFAFEAFFPGDAYTAGAKVPLLEKGENGFTVSSISLPEVSEAFPAPAMQDELLATSIRKIPSKGVYECKLLYLNHPTQENENERPFFPAVPLLVQQSSQYVVSVLPDNYQQHPEKMVWNFADALKQQKLHPSTICVQRDDERTFLFLKDLC